MKKKRALIIVFLFSAATNGMENRKQTNFLIVHHSDTEVGNVEIFRRVHKKDNGWEDIGYHYVITNGKGGKSGGPDGEVQIGRPIEKIGAHAKGRNHNSVGICLVGKDKFTDKQIESLLQLLLQLCNKYNLEPLKAIQPHHEKCPGPGLLVNRPR
ncbi:MAG: N-acetylmuramoyl-L-alanine amidase [bacterium]|nr:N-acetylmuramoyl-L-alanine amidase [bacterium]